MKPESTMNKQLAFFHYQKQYELGIITTKHWMKLRSELREADPSDPAIINLSRK